MTRSNSTRHLFSAANVVTAAGLLVLALATPVAATALTSLAPHGSNLAFPQQSSPQQHPAPIERMPPPSIPSQSSRGNGMGRPNPYKQHLAQWMESHRDLTLDQQQRALDAEPGFRQLQPDVQLRMHQRLAQLNSMAPGQRERVFARTEAMERLSMPQRQQVRSALGDLGALPEDRRRAVARTFRALRDVPEPQRQVYLNSPQARAQFSDHERMTLNNLFSVVPYLPPPAPAYQPQTLGPQR